MYDMLSYMNEVSIRELQQNLRQVMQKVERGQALVVTRRRRPIARLVPLRERQPATPWPDLEARTRSVFGNRLVGLAGSQVVREARGER
jgi:prevent-host-death family protein